MKVVKYYLEGLGTRGFWLVNWCKFRVGRYISWWTCSFLVFQTSSFMVKSLSTMPLFITTCPTGGLPPQIRHWGSASQIWLNNQKGQWNKHETTSLEELAQNFRYVVHQKSEHWKDIHVNLELHAVFLLLGPKKIIPQHSQIWAAKCCDPTNPFHPAGTASPKGAILEPSAANCTICSTGPRLGRSYNDELPNSVLLGLCVQHRPNNSCGRVVVRVDFGI